MRVLLLLALLMPVSCPAALNEFVDLAPYVNSDLTRYTSGGAYPQRGGYIRINDVAFRLAAGPGEGHTAIVQAFSDPALPLDPAGIADHGTSDKHGYVIAIPIQRKNVQSVYILMNSAYGQCGEHIGDLLFIGGAGEKYAYPLREGVNIRDHNNGNFCNTVRHLEGTANFGNVRFDFQRVDLPNNFSTSLDRIVFRGNHKEGFSGAPFIAAITLHRTQERADSTIRYGESLPDTQADSTTTYRDYCMQNRKTSYCTPVNSSVTQISPDSYRVVLPAHLVFGAAIPNPQHRPVHVEIESGVVCLNGLQGSNSCFDAQRPYPPAGPGYLDPNRPPGSLYFTNIGSETNFSVNGRWEDEVPIAGSNGKIFRAYEGSITFVVRIGSSVPKSDQK